MSNSYIKSISLILILTILNSSCVSESNRDSGKQGIVDSNVPETKDNMLVNDTIPSALKMINLRSSEKIKVLTMRKEIKKDSTDVDEDKCRLWTLTARQFESVIKDFVSMTSEGQYLSYSFYQCQISGEMMIDDIKYKYWLGAGGTLTLKRNNRTFYYGCSGNKCREYFISGELSEQELN